MWKTKGGRVTAEGAARIRELRAAGKTYQAIAEELRLTMTTIYTICKGKSHALEPVVPNDGTDRG